MVMHPQDASTKNGLLVTHYGKHSVFVISLEDAQRLHLLKRDKRYRDALKAINADMK